MNNTIVSPTDASIILTYRCPMRCVMCNIWKNPTNKKDEITAEDLKCLPKLKFINLTGGEPFIREDLADIVEECYKHTDRIVISTSGWFEDRVIALAKKFPNIGIRISIEGLSCKNDELRGREGDFDKALRTLLALKHMGLKDIGFGCTVSNYNSGDMLKLYQLSLSMGMEFATAAFHNSYYFHKGDNVITNKEEVTNNFKQLIEWQLKEKSPKSWFRAWFNMGLINYIEGGRRMLPCEAGMANFFIDPWGEVMPCNGLESCMDGDAADSTKELDGDDMTVAVYNEQLAADPNNVSNDKLKPAESDTPKTWSMGNIHDTKDFMDIWNSEKGAKVRDKVRRCPKNCWMVGTASPVMHKYIKYPLKWALQNKLRSMQGKNPCIDAKWCDVGQDPCQGDLRGKL